jgi:hypothetical protein
MGFSEWFHHHLQASADGFVWGVEQVPTERRYRQPPTGLGEWTVARHIFHMVYYEQRDVLPVMQQWLGAPEVVSEWGHEEVAWQASCTEPIEHLLSQFRAVRREQLALLPRFVERTWHEQQESGWGPVTLLWVVSKTYQHTAEHTNDVLRIALFWDRFITREQEGVVGNLES